MRTSICGPISISRRLLFNKHFLFYVHAACLSLLLVSLEAPPRFEDPENAASDLQKTWEMGEPPRIGTLHCPEPAYDVW